MNQISGNQRGVVYLLAQEHTYSYNVPSRGDSKGLNDIPPFTSHLKPIRFEQVDHCPRSGQSDIHLQSTYYFTVCACARLRRAHTRFLKKEQKKVFLKIK